MGQNLFGEGEARSRPRGGGPPPPGGGGGVAAGRGGRGRLRALDRWSVIQEARAEWSAPPIVVVSARGTEHDRVHALEIGADDYLVKPFSMKELVARVRAAARRGIRREETPRGEPIEIEELRVGPPAGQAY